jgi:phosphoribosylformimino-5-aminoimidazole carboxamide ribotide isomerase
MRIIPAIDILGGKCVRLTRGDYSSSKIYNENPLEVARQFEDKGFEFLHLVDLDGAREKRIVNYRILELTASKTSLKIDFGGGIRTDDDLRIAFNSGAKQVTAGSVALTEPSTFLNWIGMYTPEKIILGADCINREIATNGWTEKSDQDIVDFIKHYSGKGVKYSICTDVNKDGMMNGPACELYREILSAVKINLVASGGISSIEDIEEVKNTGCEGVIIGKAIYEGRIKLEELARLC